MTKSVETNKPFKVLILEAISALKNRKGSSLVAIENYIKTTYAVLNETVLRNNIKLSLKRLVENDTLHKIKASYAITKPIKKTSPKKTSPKKTSPKKTSPKKTSPKKTSPKKTSQKKTSPKSPKTYEHIKFNHLDDYNCDTKTKKNVNALSKDEVIHILKNKSMYRNGMSTKSKEELCKILGIKSKKYPHLTVKEAENTFSDLYTKLDIFDNKKFKKEYKMFQEFYKNIEAYLRAAIWVSYKYGRLSNLKERKELDNELKQKIEKGQVKEWLDDFTSGFDIEQIMYSLLKHFNPDVLHNFDNLYEKYSEYPSSFFNRVYKKYVDNEWDSNTELWF